MANYDEAHYDSGAFYDEPNLNPSTTMINLSRFLEAPFDDEGISLDELISFSTDHLQRMISNNPGALFNARITATNTALGVVESCTTSDQTKLGLRKSAKLSKNLFRDALPNNIARLHAAVVYKYGPDAPQLLECFQQGRAVFGSCTDDHVENHLQTLLNGSTAHQADLGAPVVAELSRPVFDIAGTHSLGRVRISLISGYGAAAGQLAGATLFTSRISSMLSASAPSVSIRNGALT